MLVSRQGQLLRQGKAPQGYDNVLSVGEWLLYLRNKVMSMMVTKLKPNAFVPLSELFWPPFRRLFTGK